MGGCNKCNHLSMEAQTKDMPPPGQKKKLMGKDSSNNSLNELPEGLAALIAAVETMESQSTLVFNPQIMDNFNIENYSSTAPQPEVKTIYLKKLPAFKSHGAYPNMFDWN